MAGVSVLSIPFNVGGTALRVAFWPARATVRLLTIVLEDALDTLQTRPAPVPSEPSESPLGPLEPLPSEEASTPAPPWREPADVAPPAPPLEPPPVVPSVAETPEPETVLVAESADPGAEEGAGAELRIDTPWPRYSRMTAPAVVDRLVAEPDSVVALVLLYERSHRNRRTVVEAAERELARRAGG